MLASTRLFADETVVPVLDPGRGRTRQGYFWAMARDDRPWGGSQPPRWFTATRLAGDIPTPTRCSGGYSGILQCDGYGAYKKFAGSKSAETAVTLAFLLSHVRRGSSRSGQRRRRSRRKPCSALRRSTRSRRASAASAADRLAARQAEEERWSRTVYLVRGTVSETARRGPTAGAIRYALNHWDGPRYLRMDASSSTTTASSAPCGQSVRRATVLSPAATRAEDRHAWPR